MADPLEETIRLSDLTEITEFQVSGFIIETEGQGGTQTHVRGHRSGVARASVCMMERCG
jgi:hypothetical protein